MREGDWERARGGGEAVRRAISRYRERERESPVGNAPWLPMQATCVPRSFSTGTMCLPLVMVDMALGLKASAGLPGHGTEFQAGPYVVLNSYHCSRLNTNTGRLTPAMFEAVFRRARAIISG